MHEQRLTTRLIKYWEKLKKDEPAPRWQKFNSTVVEDLWQNCMALQYQPGEGNKRLYTYVHCGSEISKGVGSNLTGQSLTTDMKFFPGAHIIKRIDEVFVQDAITPLEDDGQFVNDNGKVVKYRACLLAFVNHNSAISHVLVGVSWRAF